MLASMQLSPEVAWLLYAGAGYWGTTCVGCESCEPCIDARGPGFGLHISRLFVANFYRLILARRQGSFATEFVLCEVNAGGVLTMGATINFNGVQLSSIRFPWWEILTVAVKLSVCRGNG